METPPTTHSPTSHHPTDLTTPLAGLTLDHPIIAACGPWTASVAEIEAVAKGGAAAVTVKTATTEPRLGHPSPNFITWDDGALNALGLPNPGIHKWLDLFGQAQARLDAWGVPTIASVYAETPDEFAALARQVAPLRPALLELNASCPNLGKDPARLVEGIAATTAAVKAAVTCPISVKLSPSTPDIGKAARAVEEAGADVITAVNTMPAMLIDIETGRPSLSNTTGGLSGAALKPIALRCVYEITRAVKIPVIGMGGVMTGRDAVEMLMAGATAVGVGTAIALHGPRVLGRIGSELDDWLTAHGYESVDAVRGLAHRV
ncbi:MAG: dihydroorotate dehydrogenase [Anaerolineae bacterium]|nr:dihydroorotate dehydrogenase [Anaerolineae bacterium]